MIEKNMTEARQAESAPRHMVSKVLIAGVVLGIAGLVAAFVFVF